MYTVYVLRNPEGCVYIGQTGNLEKRLAEHNLGEGRWTSGKGPWELVETEEFDTRGAAMRRERALKSGRLNQELRRRINARAGGG